MSYATRRVITIEIVSDTIWPWCFVGKRRMESAIQRASSNTKFDGVSFDVQWKPYQLDASLPREGKDKLTSYKQKFGEEKIASMIPYMKQVGDDCGIKFSYGGKIGNTFDSHRLIWKARQQGGSALQNTVVENLFRAYFEEEKNVGDSSVLLKCAQDSGVSALEDEEEGERETQEEITSFQRKYRISGVPFFIIDGKHSLSGAQGPEAFTSIFEELVSRK